MSATTCPRMKVVLADDHPIVLSGLKGLIQTDTAFEIVATCRDGNSALEAIRTLRPDLAVLDVSMPNLTGLDVLGALASERLEVKVVFLTASATDDQIVTAVARGARGILLKDAAADALLECLHTVAAGSRWLPPDLVTSAMEREAGRRVEVDRLKTSLTPRERELVILVAEGLSNKEIARRLSLAEGTVKIHLHNIFQKLGVANRTAMTALALTYRDYLAR
ncbi:response regulator [Sabulicella rubraurantiaca]|uniref:response regulator n=1 Tax=Sabulicella rubraurantiaca TaxID=2811429 RepID=UPI001A974E29|nr:response regulator transcription factor [Sabulicella rubraurantiaca]